MKQINLLPLNVRERSAKQQIVPFLVISVVVAVAAAGIVWFALRESIASTKQTIADQQLEQQQTAAANAKTLQASAVSTDLQSRIDKLNTLSKTDVDWSKTFTYVGALTPQDIYLNGFSIGTTDNKMTLQTTGIAPSNLSFAQFMESLRTSKRVQKPSVTAFTYDPVKGTVTFSVSWVIPTDEISYSQ